jgi:iron(III) transport system ATP-binding protein
MVLPISKPGSENQATPPRIVVRNLSKRYGLHGTEAIALDNVSLQVNAGEKLVLLGPSGCGKTTLLRCVAGLEKPDAGEIEINDHVVYSSEKGVFVLPEYRGISMVFQSYALWPHMSVFENVAYPLVNTHVPRSEIIIRVTEVLELVGCASYAQRYPSQLSGGQQQRISLARAIVGRDAIVLFDEPLSNVDAQVREQLRGELTALQRRLGFSALYVTHDQSEALALADRLAIMEFGRVAQIGTVRDIYDHPVSRYVADFTGATNILSGEVELINNETTLIGTSLGRFAVPRKRSGIHKLTVGQAADIIIRPEHLHVLHSQPVINGFPVLVSAAMFLGVYSEYRLNADDGTTMILRSTHADSLSEGERVWIGVDPSRIVVFPASPGNHSHA